MAHAKRAARHLRVRRLGCYLCPVMTGASPERDLYRILQVDPHACQAVIHAAYRALARIVHPDQQLTGDAAAMVTVNTAYAVLRDMERRARYDRERAAPTPVVRPERPTSAPIVPPPPRAHGAGRDATVLSQGRYAGWTLEQLVRQDPDYLRWLRRHTSGVRYRTEIDRLLERAATPTKRR